MSGNFDGSFLAILSCGADLVKSKVKPGKTSLEELGLTVIPCVS